MAKVVNQKPIARNASFHAFNGDFSLVALSPNTDEVWIYKTNGKLESEQWSKQPDWVLTEHGGFISGIDWHGPTNTLVTCGHDRNAYVWKYNKDVDEWKPTLVILRINRAATAVKWSPNGQKFAVASGAKCVPVCHFEESNDWWISKMIKSHKSTVTSVAWCPNNKYLITGACDFKARIFSAYIEGLDSADGDKYDSFGWKDPKEFGNELCSFDGAGAWVNDVAWSPNGDNIAYVGQGSSIHFATLGAGGKSGVTGETKILCPNLPYLNVEFLTDNTVIASGFDNNPRLYVNDGGWKELTKIDPESEEKKDGGAKKAGFGSAFNKFQQADSKGEKFGAAAKEVECLTLHKCTILDLKVHSKTRVSTSGLDGRVLVWDLSPISGMK